jgi:hypothetical protein
MKLNRLLPRRVAAVGGLAARIRELENAVEENRRLNRRVAELLDVVTELLLPLADRDEERVREVLARYRDESFHNGG